MTKQKDTFGIDMKKWCDEHEAFLSEELKNGADINELIKLHEKKTAYLSHERLIHLIVTVMTVMIELFILGLVFFLPQTQPLSSLIALSVLILLGFYFWHYFFLENRVQHWYKIHDELRHCKQIT